MLNFEKISASLQKKFQVKVSPEILSEVFFSGVFSGKTANQVFKDLKANLAFRVFIDVVNFLRPFAEEEIEKRPQNEISPNGMITRLTGTVSVNQRANKNPKGYRKTPDKGEIFVDDSQGMFLASRAKSFAKPKSISGNTTVFDFNKGKLVKIKKGSYMESLH